MPLLFMEDIIPDQTLKANGASDNISVLKPRTEGGEVNLEEAVRENYKIVYRFALHVSKNPEEAADLTQHAYETLVKKHHQITDTTKVKSWLQSIVYRRFIDQKRRIIRFPQVEFDEENNSQQASTPDSADRIDAQTAMDALVNLEEDLRIPISLFYLESYSYKEIARVLDLPVGTVMSRLYRAKKKLYQHLTRRS